METKVNKSEEKRIKDATNSITNLLNVKLIGKSGVVIDNIITTVPSICGKVPKGSTRVSVDISKYVIPIPSHPDLTISYLAVDPSKLKFIK